MSKAAVALLVVLGASWVVSAFGDLEKRDAPLQTLVIPVTVDENLRYGVEVNMSANNQPQSFRFALSTGTGYTVVAGSSCTTCEGVKSYNATASTSSVDLHTVKRVGVANVAASGSLVSENCTLHQANGSAWAYPNQAVLVANESVAMFTRGISGIFGLGTNGRDGNFSQTVFGGWLRRNPTRTNFTYGMALNPPKDGSTDGGQLHWVAPITNFYQGDVAWNKLTAFNATAAINTDWYVMMDGWNVKGNSGFGSSRSGGGLQAFLDPWLPVLVFPQIDTKSIYASVPGAKIIDKGSLVNVWTVPCSAKMNLTLTFGSFSTWLDERTLITKKGTQCQSMLQEWASTTATEYLLGSAFIASVYLIFSISNANDGALGLAARSAVTTRNINTVSVVGIALGSGAFGIAVLIAAYIFIKRHKKRKNEKRMREMMQRNPHPFQSPLHSPLRSPGETTNLLSPSPVYSPVSPSYATYSDGHASSPSAATAGSPLMTHYYNLGSDTSSGPSPPSYPGREEEFHPYRDLIVQNPSSPLSPQLGAPPPGKARLRRNNPDPPTQ